MPAKPLTTGAAIAVVVIGTLATFAVMFMSWGIVASTAYSDEGPDLWWLFPTGLGVGFALISWIGTAIMRRLGLDKLAASMVGSAGPILGTVTPVLLGTTLIFLPSFIGVMAGIGAALRSSRRASEPTSSPPPSL